MSNSPEMPVGSQMPAGSQAGGTGRMGWMARARSDWRVVAAVSAVAGFSLAAALFAMTAEGPPRPPSGDLRQCKDQVRGKIAWNYQGDTDWDESALDRLCGGTTRPSQPPLCFDLVFHGRIDWGGGTQWRWQPAVDLCAGTDDARTRAQCFKDAIASGADFRDAIEACNPSERTQGRTTCDRLVQGNIAWNDDGDTSWSQRQLDLLCGQTANPTQPLLCFDRLYHGRGDWEGIINRDWRRAAQLCSGTASVRQTMHCVRDAIGAAGANTPTILDVGEPAPRNAADPDAVFNAALRACNPPDATAEAPAACRAFVQGNIAWSGAGYADWQDAVLERLCGDTSAPQQPGLCFSRAMYGGIDLGEDGLSKWAYAVDLCAGTNSADARLSCFARERRAGSDGRAAINACQDAPET